MYHFATTFMEGYNIPNTCKSYEGINCIVSDMTIKKSSSIICGVCG